ncbi:MAG: uroporphyrinogen-III synthase [Trueperaceae bacterium]
MTDVPASGAMARGSVRVVLTHAEGRLEGLRARLRALGFDVLHRPSIAIRPRTDGPTRDVAGALLDLPWLLFASRSAAEAWSTLGVGYARRPAVEPESVRPNEPAPRPPEPAPSDPLRIGAIGPGTAAALRAVGARVDLVAESSTAEGLAFAFARHPHANGPVGLAQGSRARPTLAQRLREAGYETRAAVLYDTDTLPWDQDPGDRAVSSQPTVVVVASPSAVASLPQEWRGGSDADDRRATHAAYPRIVAIGPTTADAVRAQGAPCWVAETADVDGIVTAVVSALASEGASAVASEGASAVASEGVNERGRASGRALGPTSKAAEHGTTREAGTRTDEEREEAVDD